MAIEQINAITALLKAEAMTDMIKEELDWGIDNGLGLVKKDVNEEINDELEETNQNMLKIETFFGTYNCKLSMQKYSNNGNTAIRILSKNEEFDFWEPFAMLTVNFKKLSEDYAYLDTNNCPWAEELMEEYNLGEPTDIFEMSGWCVYPMYKLNLEEIQKYIG